MSATTSPPPALSIDADAIPAELRELPRWCVFQVTRGSGGTLKKRPLIAGIAGESLAKCNDPRTWRPFDVALADAEVRVFYPAFAFDRDLPYFFIDGDDVVQPDGTIRPDVALLRDRLNTYTELSLSGRGLHMIGRGAFPAYSESPAPPPGCKAIERYPLHGGRFCVLTGDVVPGFGTIEERSDVLAALFPPRATAGVNGNSDSAKYGGPAGRLSDEEAGWIGQWAKPHWTDGRRHHMALYLSGYLGKQGVSREQAVALIERCAAADADPGAKVAAAHATYDDLETGADVSGWRGLHDPCGLTGDDLAPLNEVLEAFWRRHNTAIRPITNGREGARAEAGPTDDTDEPQPNNSDQTNDTEPNDAETERRRPSQATALVAMATAGDTEFFTDGSGEPFATFTVNTHCETAALSTKGFKHWLGKRYYDKHRNAPGAQAVQDALNVLAGKALYNGAIHTVWCRLAKEGDTLWLDLGDDAWRAVRIRADGWTVVDSTDVPVKFRRPRGMLPLPEPDPAGDLTPLAGLVDRGDEDDAERLCLLIGWLIGTFQTDGGRAILELLGEQGSGKTLLARLLRHTVDPNAVPLRTMPRDERDLVIAASNSLIVAVDNASELKPWMSDAFCRLSTGGGIGGRELYTNLDEVVLEAQRSSLITGINSVATRGDLLDRTLSVTLPPIPATARRTEALVWREFERVHARLLGGVLNAVASALANRDRVNLLRKPRLADFIEFVEAAAPALGWDAGDFAAAFEASRRCADAVAIESLPVGPVLLTFLQDRETWQGTASTLLHELASLADDETKRDRDWPKRGNRLSNQLRQLAPNLRHIGVGVGWERSGPAGTKLISLTKKTCAEDRQYRQNRQAPPENRQSDAKTQADDGWGDDRQPSSADRQSSSADRQQRASPAEAEADDIPHEQANFAGEVAWEPASADDTDDTDDGLPPFSDDDDGRSTCSDCGGPAPADGMHWCDACRAVEAAVAS